MRQVGDNLAGSEGLPQECRVMVDRDNGLRWRIAVAPVPGGVHAADCCREVVSGTVQVFRAFLASARGAQFNKRDKVML